VTRTADDRVRWYSDGAIQRAADAPRVANAIVVREAAAWRAIVSSDYSRPVNAATPVADRGLLLEEAMCGYRKRARICLWKLSFSTPASGRDGS